MSRVRSRDRGSVTVLVIGFAIVLLLAVAVVVDVSAVALAKRAAASAADGAATAAAQQVDRAALLQRGLGDGVPLDEVAAQQAVADYQLDAQQGQPGLALDAQVDGATATVTAVRRIRLPLVGPLGVDPFVDVTAVSTVRSPVLP